MADPRGFLKVRERELPGYRPVSVRLMDYADVMVKRDPTSPYLARQASRCMDCGIPFCHQGCPLGNLIPDWNDLVRRGLWREASDRLHATNNFPEFTGRVCPAPCEDSCVLGISQPAVTIKNIEVSIVDEAFRQGFLPPVVPERLSGKTVAVIGSGPAGLAAAQQLTRSGHTVVVFERDEAVGGLLRFGIPDFKLEKHHIDRRIEQMVAEGTRFRVSTQVGVDVSWAEVYETFDAVVVATGASVPRDLPLPGRDLGGIHFAMDYLVRSNRQCRGSEVSDPIDARGKHVIVIGGGDTGSDCIGTALRQGAASVTNLAIGVEPPKVRPESEPWPVTPRLFEVSSSHEEGGSREFLASTVEFVGSHGQVEALRVATTEYLSDGRRVPTAGTERDLPADLVLIALGFTGAETDTFVDSAALSCDKRGRIARTDEYESSMPGVFVAGDAGRGQSLIVWAIAEGRAAAASVDEYLQGGTELPRPVKASTMALRP